MQVEARTVDIFRRDVRKADPNVRLVRALVFRKPDVAVDPEQRPADRSRVSLEVRADLLQMRRDVGDELERGGLYVLFVAVLVGFEPFTPVVEVELPEKVERATSSQLTTFHHAVT